jgi:predicted PilT family ATPase
MRVLTISQLLCLTRIEITEIAKAIVRQLPALPEGSIEKQESLATLENIRIVLARPEFTRRGRGLQTPAR